MTPWSSQACSSALLKTCSIALPMNITSDIKACKIQAQSAQIALCTLMHSPFFMRAALPCLAGIVDSPILSCYTSVCCR